jgi:hypothetical protein
VPYKWLTPDADPGTTRQIILIVPESDEFEAIIRGALLPLLDPDNFEQYGTLTPEETVSVLMPVILDTLQWVEV